ncbi:uncharacterized protein dos isoform X2 [Epargyreus clarus]|uniref:uncharacterized protein dos isoform X2 n=1 Tax=Epargyreus clarus TaxID=520877 RepID=UPI003C2DC112
MSKNIVFEGWLTKSPPMKRIWRTKWRRRWFALRQSGELPGQYFLDYYADRNCRRLKGTINLDLCEQVDAGLHMERNSHGTLDPKLRGSVFTIQTQSRTYHLEADCEADMERWVDAICRVCGLRSTEDSPSMIVTYQNNSSVSVANEQYECGDSTGPYIPISECITGVRAQVYITEEPHRAFTFDPKNIVISTRAARGNQMYMSQPYIRPPNNNAEFSENDSNLSEDESRSLNASQSNIRDWPAAKSFTKSAASPRRNGLSEDGPPVPPRPPKTFAMGKDSQKESFSSPKFLVPVDSLDRDWPGRTLPWMRTSRRISGTAPPSPRRATLSTARNHHDDDDGFTLDQLSMHYCNLSIIPPTVDRNLKPRHSSHSIGQFNYLTTQVHGHPHDDLRSDVLQYLDLDLQTSNPITTKPQELPRKPVEVHHGKSHSAAEADSAYKTVDFLKTEAFNITRQDAEASRSNQQ